jgi:hypothetical protein
MQAPRCPAIIRLARYFGVLGDCIGRGEAIRSAPGQWRCRLCNHIWIEAS